MFLLLLVCLNVVILGKSWEITILCGNTTVVGIYKICQNQNCIKDSSLQFFCQNVYEHVFKCHEKNIPLSFICDGRKHCKDGIDEDLIVCKHAICKKNFYRCNDKKCISIVKICDGAIDCENGQDETTDKCEQLGARKKITCQPVFKEYHQITCRTTNGFQSTPISCSKPLPQMAVAELTCKKFYSSIQGPSYQKILCQKNGEWSQKPIECKSDCGNVNNIKFTPLILKGWSITPDLWPWYAALFCLETDQWVFFCSSSIISRNMVITAAHCVWKMPKENIKVVAGKFYSTFVPEEPTEQRSNIEKLIFHPLYQDSLGNYASDVALIVLSDRFFWTETVVPICMNWTLRNFVQEDGKHLEGKVVGMGITENATVSLNLRAATMKIIKNENCIRNQRFEFRKYVTMSTFCAGRENGSAVCNGDSGSGLAVKNKESSRWVLEGIVSISPKNPDSNVCDSKYFSIFTNIGIYVNWVYGYHTQYSIE